MIGATKRWLRRNHKGLAIGLGVVGAGYFVAQYVVSKVSEARERMNSDRIARENLRRRFEQNQADCTFTVLALLPTATENILEALPVEELTQELQKKRAERLARLNGAEAQSSDPGSATTSVTDDDGRSLASFQTDSYIHTGPSGGSSIEGDGQRLKKSKAQLWNEVKITAITRSFLLIYTLSLLTLLTRIQLNLLGRRNYLASVMSLASPPSDAATIKLEDHDDDIGPAFGNDFETNRRYLTFSWWLLHRGWRGLMDRVQEAVNDVFATLNPREDITPDRLSELTMEVRRKVEGSTEEERRSTKWLPYLLPPREEEETVLQESGVLISSVPSSPETAVTLRHLLDETSDLIESPSFTRILTLLNNEGFTMLIDQKCAANGFKTSPTSQPAPQPFSSTATIVPQQTKPHAKLATVLAVLTREAHSIGNGTNPPNEYLVSMEQGVRDLEAFAAVVYSSNFDLEIPRSTLVPTVASGSASSSATARVGEGDLDELRMSASSTLGASWQVPSKDLSSPATGNMEVMDSTFEKAWGKAAAPADNSEVL